MTSGRLLWSSKRIERTSFERLLDSLPTLRSRTHTVDRSLSWVSSAFPPSLQLSCLQSSRSAHPHRKRHRRRQDSRQQSRHPSPSKGTTFRTSSGSANSGVQQKARSNSPGRNLPVPSASSRPSVHELASRPADYVEKRELPHFSSAWQHTRTSSA